MEENKQNRKVGISGLKMNNSSISNSTIIGGNSDANVGIFDTEMENTHLSDLKISDVNTINAAPNPKEIKQKPNSSIISNLWWKIAIPLIIGIILLAIQNKWFMLVVIK